jgi:HlyD family secretion protein
MRRRLLILVLLVAVAGGAYYLYALPPRSLMLTGIVTTHDVIISPQVDGRLARLLVTEGDAITHDQVVALIDPRELQADSAYYASTEQGVTAQVREAEDALHYQEHQTSDQIAQAESNVKAVQAQQAEATATLENARLVLERTEQLARQGLTPASDLDRARTAFDAAKAHAEALARQVEAAGSALALARSNATQVAMKESQLRNTENLEQAARAQRQKADVRLAYTEVHSPIDGIVDVRAARTGEVVNRGQPLLTVINPDDLWIRADVEETYIDRVRLGDRFTIRLPSGDTREGTVFYRGQDAAFATQRDVSRTKRDIKTFEIRLRADNTDRRLAVGMTAYVLLPLER